MEQKFCVIYLLLKFLVVKSVIFIIVSAHPWLRGLHKVPLDILVFRLMKSYIRSSVIRRAALKVNTHFYT